MGTRNKAKANVSKVRQSPGLPVVNMHAAGIDIGGTVHHVAFGDGAGGHEQHEFGSFTEDLVALVALLKSKGVTTAAMEATGVYFVPLYLMLEEAGIEPVLVNASHCKNVTGRKADDTDAAWIQRLHACALLRKSFQPEGDFRVLREYVRHRKQLIASGSDSVRRMLKALELMNIKIQNVISDILGKTGMDMVRAILGGERDAAVLATFRNGRIKASGEEVRKSLDGIWRDEHLFMLKQAYDDYQFRLGQVKDCEERIMGQLLGMVAAAADGDVTGCVGAEPVAPGSPVKKKSKPRGRKNQFDADLEPILASLAGVNVCAIPGMGEVSALEFIAETGTDMARWPSAGHFAAWLNLAPNTKKTGGKVVSTRMMKKKNAAGQTLKMAGQSLWHAKAPLGDYYRRMKARLGGKGAVLASAHKLSRIIYTMMLEQREYSAAESKGDQQKYRERKIRQLEKQLEKLKNMG